MLLVLVLVLGAVGKGCDWAADAVINPWAHGIRGRTLTGRWAGVLVTPSGTRALLLLDLHRATYDSGIYTTGPEDPEIEGSGLWCEGRRSVAYRLQGDYRSGDVSLSLAPQKGATGLIATGAEGSWRADTLRLSFTLLQAGPAGYHYDSANPDMRHPVPVVFHRAERNGAGNGPPADCRG